MDRQRWGLAALAALLLAAGLLPWVSGTPLALRLLSLPFLLAGVILGAAAARMPAVRAHLRGERPIKDWPLLEPGCGAPGGCRCGAAPGASSCDRPERS
ncbi:MAG: hypothetical protein ACR2F6_08375 [Mycobacteriales bacterium]